MKRSVSRDHLPSNQSTPNFDSPMEMKDKNELYESRIQASNQVSNQASNQLTSFSNPQFDTNQISGQQNVVNNGSPSQLSTCWKVTLVVSSLFANGIAAASIFYIWKHCNC